MAFSFRCPVCSNVLQVEENMAGQQAECPFCRQRIIIPSPDANYSGVPPQAFPQNSQDGGFKLESSPESFFLVALFNTFLGMLRKNTCFSNFSRVKDYAAKAGAVLFLALGAIHLITTIAIASKLNASSGWKLFLMDVLYLITAICVVYGCMAIFQQFNRLIETSGKQEIPESVLNIIAIVSFGLAAVCSVFGIVEAIDKETMEPLYMSLYGTVTLLPLGILTLAPSNIGISVKDSSPVAALTGIFYFFMKATLFTIPITWAYLALHKICYLVTHLGSSNLADVSAATGGIELVCMMMSPLGNYVTYLLLNFFFMAILSCIERKKD